MPHILTVKDNIYTKFKEVIMILFNHLNIFNMKLNINGE